MYSIKRHLEPVLARRFRNNKAILISGPRQTGKSTLCRYLFQDLNQVNLDNALARNQAAEDTALFLKNNRPPVLIDEIQKCPSLFEGIKEYLEAHPDDRSSFVLTGSQKLKLTEGASESLAGRVSVNELQGLSLREITAVDFNRHFVPTEEYFELREKNLEKSGDIWSIIHRGAFPELYANPELEWEDFYSSYVSTYLERDVNELIRVGNSLAFTRFMTSVAARTAQKLNCSHIAAEVGVDVKTIQAWISILERSGLVYILRPYCPSVLNRAVRTPKIYFRDTGLCSYLTRWLTADNLKNGAMAGAMFETFVVNEILKSYSNEGSLYDFTVSYYNGRDRKKLRKDGMEILIDGEIDLIIEENGILHPVEIKMSASPKADMASKFDVLDGIPDKKRGLGCIICLYDRKVYLRDNLVSVPLEYL